MCYHKPLGRAIGDTHRDAIAIPKAQKPFPGQLELDLKPAINPDWPEPSTKQFDADEEPTKCSNT